MGQRISTIGQLLPTMALADELKQQLNRPGKAFMLKVGSHLPEPSLLQEQVLRAGILQLASCITRPSAPMRSPSSIKVPRDLDSWPVPSGQIPTVLQDAAGCVVQT